MKDGYPAVSYADGVYEDSFTAARITHTPGESRAQNVTVRDMHEFVQSIPGATPLIIANAGTGRALDAAEWVRWANVKMGYNARYVEVGNELDGDWEPGHIMPNGEHMTGTIYAERFREFAKAIKAVDPTVKVGGAAGGTGEGSFNYDMLRLAGDVVDFVSIHNYYGTRSDTSAEAFDKLVTATRHEVGLAKRWIRQFQPQRAEQIEIIYTEWNLANQPGDFCSDMYSALWSSWFLALAAENGVHAANQGICSPTQTAALRHDPQQPRPVHAQVPVLRVAVVEHLHGGTARRVGPVRQSPSQNRRLPFRRRGVRDAAEHRSRRRGGGDAAGVRLRLGRRGAARDADSPPVLLAARWQEADVERGDPG